MHNFVWQNNNDCWTLDHAYEVYFGDFETLDQCFGLNMVFCVYNVRRFVYFYAIPRNLLGATPNFPENARVNADAD